MSAPRPFWACRGCDRVVPGRAFVRWCEGLTEHAGWRCATCVDALRAREARVDAPIDSWVSGVVIDAREGDMATLASAAA